MAKGTGCRPGWPLQHGQNRGPAAGEAAGEGQPSSPEQCGSPSDPGGGGSDALPPRVLRPRRNAFMIPGEAVGALVSSSDDEADEGTGAALHEHRVHGKRSGANCTCALLQESSFEVLSLVRLPRCPGSVERAMMDRATPQNCLDMCKPLCALPASSVRDQPQALCLTRATDPSTGWPAVAISARDGLHRWKP